MASRLKRSNCPKWNFFSKNNTIFMYLLVPVILQNFKRILRADPELSACAIFGQKMAHLSWTIFFWYKPLLLLSSTCWPFSLCKIYKKFLQPIQSCEDAPFLGPKWFIYPKQFLSKINNIIFIYLLASFIVQNFKKVLPADPELWGCAIFGQKMAHLPKWCFQKTC